MSESSNGYPIEKALGLAVSASEELKSFFREAGVENVHFIAGASYWSGESNSHPNLSVHLPEGTDVTAIKEKVSELVADLKKRDIRVTMFTNDGSFQR
ncbi:hypothetical protein [Agrobacterium tumefaciens]|uniref:hypothetical protein n=1 Tax=Agrobacterium tumefaciens TaxID=358 RepID=UPI001572F22A|nr:hypothetical protein [Agrobacterium tumefaciens]NTD87246.1 hypothetical protein [Agrobacterium tumefaciens]NTD95173.1 hypothetical protein [Agrobacterium tumefaciens]NTE02642.1 hypothetical protein [Agrobacterium tumefaciens]NTE14483.1 hypothetical protein [Agrobacterium tumefaciens]NTE24293.1 hypothetical protein [Agrobacterium tumefaciens]